MIKIEKMTPGCKATITRGEVPQPVFVGQLLSRADIETLIVGGGTLLYTIDEEAIVEVKGTEPKAVEPQKVPPLNMTPPVKPKVVSPKK